LIFSENRLQLYNRLWWETRVGLFGSKTAKTDDFFSIDVGASSVKVLQLRRRGDQWSIIGMGMSPLNRSIVADKNLVDVQKLADAVSLAVENARIKAKTAYTALPSSQTIAKTFNIPDGLSVIEQEDQVQLEAQNHIPESPDQLRMDYEIVGVGENNTLKVYLVATKIDQFQMLVDAIGMAGFDLKVVDVDNLAMVRAINHLIARNPLANVEAPNEILIDLGHEFTNIFAIHQGRCIFTREQNLGMKALVEEISRYAGISTTEAENVLAQGSPAENLQQVMAQFRSETANEINRMIQHFFADSSMNRVHRIWLSGGGSVMQGLVQEVAEMTGVPTYKAEPFGGFELPKHLDPLFVQKMGPTFLTAFGLAIRED